MIDNVVVSYLLQYLLVFLVELLSFFLLIVLPANLLDLLHDSLNIIFILVGACLVHVDLSRHLLQLASLGVQTLLQDRQLLSCLKSRLFLHDLSDLLNLLFLLVHEHLFLDHLLRLIDESLLQSFDLLLHLVDIWVCALEVSTAVDVKWIFEFLRESLHLELLLNQLVLQCEDLVLVECDFATLLHEDLQLSLQVALLVVQQVEVGKALSESSFSLGQRCLLDLDFLIKQGTFVVTADELRAEDVPLSENKLVFIFFELPFSGKLLNAGVQLADFVVEVLDDFSLGVHLLLALLELATMLKQSLVLFLVLEMLLRQSHLLGLDLLLQLVDLMVHDLVSALGLGYFILSLR